MVDSQQRLKCEWFVNVLEETCKKEKNILMIN